MHFAERTYRQAGNRATQKALHRYPGFWFIKENRESNSLSTIHNFTPTQLLPAACC